MAIFPPLLRSQTLHTVASSPASECDPILCDPESFGPFSTTWLGKPKIAAVPIPRTFGVYVGDIYVELDIGALYCIWLGDGAT